MTTNMFVDRFQLLKKKHPPLQFGALCFTQKDSRTLAFIYFAKELPNSPAQKILQNSFLNWGIDFSLWIMKRKLTH